MQLPLSYTSSSPYLLVVEDDTLVRTVCVRLLRACRYMVDAVENGLQALERLSQRSYDIVLTDLNMPQMNGLALIRQIQELYPDTDTIMITAFGSIDTVKRALKLGAFDYLTKPLDSDELERTVQNCLQVREARRLRQETERLTEMVSLLQLSRTISSTLDADAQVREFMHQLWTRFKPSGVSLSLHDSDDRRLMLLGQHGMAATIVSGRSVAVPSTANEDRLLKAHAELIDEVSTTNQVVQLLRVQDRPVGVLQLNWEGDEGRLSEGDIQLLEVYTAQVAVALENSRLYGALKRLNVETIGSLAAAIDARDPYTRGHSEQVTKYAVLIAERMDSSPEWIDRVRYGALLHDIGKIGQPDSILRKPGPLTPEERAFMEQHPAVGARIVAAVRALGPIGPIIEAHHERFDGKGYPNGLHGETIPLEARIISVADGFDAMTSDRAYRKAMPIASAVDILHRGRDEQWQADIVDTFITIVDATGEVLLESKGRVSQPAWADTAAGAAAAVPPAPAVPAEQCDGGLDWLNRHDG